MIDVKHLYKNVGSLEVLKDVTPEAIDAARAVAASGCIDLRLKEDAPGLYISVDAKGQGGESRVVIEGAHTNITYEAVNGKVVKEGSAPVNCDDAETSTTGIKFEIKKYSIDDMIAFANEVPSEDIAFMQDGIDMNMTIASDAIERGLSICSTMLKKDSSLAGKAKAYTAAGSENRMSGSPLPVMSSAGSGNHGITAIIPITVIGTGLGIDIKKIRRSVALSHLVTNYIKVFLGPLSPVCGCGVAAGVGAAAGLTYMQGGNVELVTSSVQGDVSAKELLKIGPQSVIGGNIKTKDMICSGRIVGNVESSGRVTLTTGSALTGDLTASTIAVMEGALLEGRFKIVKK